MRPKRCTIRRCIGVEQQRGVHAAEAIANRGDVAEQHPQEGGDHRAVVVAPDVNQRQLKRRRALWEIGGQYAEKTPRPADERCARNNTRESRKTRNSSKFTHTVA